MALTGIMQRFQGKIAGTYVLVKNTFALKNATITALGTSSQANSALISRPHTVITVAAASTNGVRLPAPDDMVNGGDMRIITNATAGNVLVYPNSGAQIGSTSVNGSVTLATGKTEIFFCQSGTQWRAFLGA
jgi:hypothetical protein